MSSRDRTAVSPLGTGNRHLRLKCHRGFNSSISDNVYRFKSSLDSSQYRRPLAIVLPSSTVSRSGMASMLLLVLMGEVWRSG
jgi:hypothetical protein